jgi:hypothetical protein
VSDVFTERAVDRVIRAWHADPNAPPLPIGRIMDLFDGRDSRTVTRCVLGLIEAGWLEFDATFHLVRGPMWEAP